MFEEHRVLALFRDEVNAHVELISGEVSEGDRREAALWLNELLNMRVSWQGVLDSPTRVIASGSFARGWREQVNTGNTKYLAARRIEILDAALSDVKKRFNQAGWD